MQPLEAAATVRSFGSHEPCACIRSARVLVTRLRTFQGDQVTLDALALADRALAIAERRILERETKGPTS